MASLKTLLILGVLMALVAMTIAQSFGGLRGGRLGNDQGGHRGFGNQGILVGSRREVGGNRRGFGGSPGRFGGNQGGFGSNQGGFGSNQGGFGSNRGRLGSNRGGFGGYRGGGFESGRGNF